MDSIVVFASSESFASFPIWMPFIPLSCQIVQAKTFNTMFNKSGKSGHPCLVPDFRGKEFSFSPLTMLAVGLSYTGFMVSSYMPSIHILWRVFIIKMGGEFH